MNDREERQDLHKEIMLLDPNALKQIERSRQKQEEQSS